MKKDLSKKDYFITKNQNTPVTEILDLFAKGCHRCALTDDNNVVTNIVSQFDLLKFLFLFKKSFN